MTPSRFSRLILMMLLMIVVGAGFGQMKPGDRRKAYGEARASIVESVLPILYPGAQVQWEPQLTVQIPGDQPRMVAVPVYVRGAASGGAEGIATVELEGKKERFIFEAQSFQRTDSPNFPTVLVVFRADTAFHINKYKELMLDPGEPLTEVKTMSIKDWTQTEWPILEVQYDTHLAGRDSFTTIEWHSVLDANTGEFISRLPFGISRRVRGGPEESYGFQLGRISPSTLLIADRMTGTRHPYQCSDPCVIDARTLLSQWVH